VKKGLVSRTFGSWEYHIVPLLYAAWHYIHMRKDYHHENINSAFLLLLRAWSTRKWQLSMLLEDNDDNAAQCSVCNANPPICTLNAYAVRARTHPISQMRRLPNRHASVPNSTSYILSQPSSKVRSQHRKRHSRSRLPGAILLGLLRRNVRRYEG